VWTPTGSAKAQARRQPIIDRYIAAVDRNGSISTGHAALESSEGVYISLYPAVEIERSPEEFSRILRATRDNDVPGLFQPDYAAESKAWCPSTRQVLIHNYDPERLERFWAEYRRTTTYNLTYRNCSSTVAKALEAAIEGASARVWGKEGGWKPFLHIAATPELWGAAQVRKRAATMAWTPGLTLDYACAQHVGGPAPFRMDEDGAHRTEYYAQVAPALAGRENGCTRRHGHGAGSAVGVCRSRRAALIFLLKHRLSGRRAMALRIASPRSNAEAADLKSPSLQLAVSLPAFSAHQSSCVLMRVRARAL
jgi:hypothetical protein